MGTKNGKQRARNGAQAEEQTPESLDQVRDILFGGQMRMVDSRLRSLEERLMEEQAALRNEFTRQLASLEDATKKGLTAHAEKLAAERAKRAEELKALGADLKEALKSLERRHQKLEETAGLADAELRDQLLKQAAALSAETSRLGEKLGTDLDRTATALRTEKLDTAALAAALTDVVSRISGESRGGKGAGRA